MLSLILAGLLSAGSAPTPEQQAAELVKQLGDPSFEVREAAAEKLIRLGSAAKAALEAGAKSTDAEVKARCQRLLPLALEWDRKQRVEQYLAKPDRPAPEDTPGLDRFARVLGKGEATRDLYLEVLREQEATLLDFSRDPKKNRERFAAFCWDPIKNYKGDGERSKLRAVPRSEVILFLVLACDRECNPGRDDPSIRTWGFDAPALHEALAGPRESEPIKKLFAAWLEHETHPVSLEWSLPLVIKYELKGCLPAARKIVHKGASHSPLCTAMEVLQRLGGKEDIKDLEQHFETTTLVLATASTDTQPGKEFSVQLGDVALGVAVTLSGQRMADYGFDCLPAWEKTLYRFAFSSAEARQASRKKWQEWREKNK